MFIVSSTFYRAALNAGRSSQEIAVCLSVCPSLRLSVKRVDCDKTEENYVQISTLYERPSSLVFYKKNGWWERSLQPEIVGQTDHVGAKSPIFDTFLPVAPQP